jgi:hypothetical protein
MSCGPAIVAIRRRPDVTRWRTAEQTPPKWSTSTYGTADSPIGRPLHTTGMPSRTSVPGSGSAPCMEANMTPSTWPATAYRSTRTWLFAEPAIISTSCLSAGLELAADAPDDRREEEVVGEDRFAVSGRISAIDSVRWVTRLRAAWLGT